MRLPYAVCTASGGRPITESMCCSRQEKATPLELEVLNVTPSFGFWDPKGKTIRVPENIFCFSNGPRPREAETGWNGSCSQVQVSPQQRKEPGRQVEEHAVFSEGSGSSFSKNNRTESDAETGLHCPGHDRVFRVFTHVNVAAVPAQVRPHLSDVHSPVKYHVTACSEPRTRGDSDTRTPSAKAIREGNKRRCSRWSCLIYDMRCCLLLVCCQSCSTRTLLSCYSG